MMGAYKGFSIDSGGQNKENHLAIVLAILSSSRNGSRVANTSASMHGTHGGKALLGDAVSV
jgi:hypothetical protein